MDRQLQALSRFVSGHPRLVVLTGAGVSTGSGIPDYRDRLGRWKRPAPVQYGDFLSSQGARQR
jgi:NAD-dependent SIR2 family protein deacetylase